MKAADSFFPLCFFFFFLNVTVCSFENPLHFVDWKFTAIKFCRINIRDFFFGGD